MVYKTINLLFKVVQESGRDADKAEQLYEGEILCKAALSSYKRSTLLNCVIALFIPNLLGVADNGSLTEVLSNNGLSYIQTETEDIYNNYFIREYYSSVTGKGAVNNIQDYL